MKTIKFIDLFSGIGGFRIAVESIKKIKSECVFSSDIDKWACETYKQNFGDYPLSDIKIIDEKNIPAHDFLCAGFPCQAFSIAGYRKGFQDTRGTLFFDIERILRYHLPKAFLLENVKGLVNHQKGKTLNVILNTLALKINGNINKERFENCLNYNVYYDILNSKNFGVPQNRERIYIIGFKDSVGKFEFPKQSKNIVDISAVLENNNIKSDITETAKFNIENNLKKWAAGRDIISKDFLLAYEIRKLRCTFRNDGLSPCLTAKMGTGGNNVPVLVKHMRKLSTRECLKIQGYPDWFVIKENNSQSYKQIGNSVSVPVIRKIAEEILAKLV